MKRLALLVVMSFVAAVLVGPATFVLAGGKTHDVKGEVISVDLEGKKITIKDEKGESKTAPVMEKALETLKTLKVGDKVILTCMDNEKGEHQGVTDIKLAAGGGA